jgi:acetoin utilization deacetylase AcuC-like enzyme
MSTAFVTDSRYAVHTLDGHPEHAGRLVAVQQALDDRFFEGHLVRLEPQWADDESLLAVHTPRYLALLEKTSELDAPALLGADTYVVPQSYEIARLAVGGVLRAVDAVLCGEAENALAAIRPPGHHATPSMGMGFCLLNNVAVAARYAQRVHHIERVLIVDYDVHHGNGTQDTFYADPTVLYISTHQFPLYPGTGGVGEVGALDGTGYTLNIPLSPGVGDVGYTGVFDEIIIPAARRFVPKLILVSVGFDAHWADPLAGMRLSLTGYDRLARVLVATARELCEGRIVFVMEGGYNLDVLGNGWANVGRVLSGDSAAVDSLGPSHSREPSVASLIDRIKQIHKLA